MFTTVRAASRGVTVLDDLPVPLEGAPPPDGSVVDNRSNELVTDPLLGTFVMLPEAVA